MVESTPEIDPQREANHELGQPLQPDGTGDAAESKSDSRIDQLAEIWQSVLTPGERDAGLNEIEKHLAKADEWPTAYRKREDRVMLLSSITLSVIFIVAVVVYISSHFSWGWSQRGGLLGGIGIGLLLEATLLVITAMMKKDFWFYLAGLGGPLALLIGAAWPLYYWIRATPDRSTEPVWALLLAGIGLFSLWALVAIGSVVLALVLSNMTDKKFSEDFAEALLVESLATALLTAADEKVWRVAENRQRMAGHIEDAAYWIQIILQAGVAKDPDTAAWLLEQRRTIVANFRQLKRWALMPQSDTHERLVDRLSKDLLASAYGSFGDVCHEEIPGMSQPQKLNSLARRALRVIRALIAALIPLGIALFLIRQNVVSGAAITPLLAVTGALPAVVLLRVLDPEVVDDLKKTQDFGLKFLGRGSDGK